MSYLSRFAAYLRTREGFVAFLLVLGCGLELSLFAVRTFVDPVPAQYPLDFGKAQWIEPATPGESTYFRKYIYVSGDVDRAWIQVAATDNFQLYVNDVRAGQDSFTSSNVSGVYDVKKLFTQGQNCIAIHIGRTSFPGSGQVRVRGFYSLVGGPVQEFLSDTSWRAATTPDGILGSYSWESHMLDDSFWAYAKQGEQAGRPASTQPAAFDPRIFEDRLSAKWIASPHASAKQVTFRTEIKLPALRRETWLQVAASGPYEVVINGALVVPRSVQTFPTQVSAKLYTQPVAPVLQASEITPWMRSGVNTIEIRVQQYVEPVSLLAAGYSVGENGDIVRFATDEAWKTRIYEKSQDYVLEPAVAVAAYGSAPWGFLQQALAPPPPLPSQDYIILLRWLETIGVVAGSVLLVWAGIPLIASRGGRIAAERIWTHDAVLHLVVAAGIAGVLISSFDIRLQSNWCYKPMVFAGMVLALALRGLLFVGIRSDAAAAASADTSNSSLTLWGRRRWMWIGIGLAMVAGFMVRVSQLNDISLDVDEMSLTNLSQGVPTTGYPHAQMGSYMKRATTYELVPYSIALSTFLFGENDTSLRFASLIYGTLAIGLMGWVAYRMFDWRAGLLAATLLALAPFNIYWSRNAFWPGQEQFFALFTIWCFYEALQTRPFRRGFLTAATVGFFFTYLTWEGSGFLLPALFIAMIAMAPRDFSWIRDWHLWRCLVIIAFIVFVQLAHRQLDTKPPYLKIGFSLADMTAPEIVYNDPTKYDPYFYVDSVLLQEGVAILTLLTCLGSLFFLHKRAIRFLLIIIAMLIFSLSEFIPVYADRYASDFEILIVLAATGVVFELVDGIRSFGKSRMGFYWSGGARAAAGLLLLLAVLACTNDYFAETYRLSNGSGDANFAWRLGVYRHDHRGAAEFVRSHYQPGDGVIVYVPHVFEFYAKMAANYSINTMIDNDLFYDGGLSTVGHYTDKFKGRPTVRSLDELQTVRSYYRRIWVVQVPLVTAKVQDPNVQEYLHEHGKVVFESYNARVTLVEGVQNGGSATVQ